VPNNNCLTAPLWLIWVVDKVWNLKNDLELNKSLWIIWNVKMEIKKCSD
jgi:hypothetical protein